MHDLNDLVLYAQVVDQGGFAAVSRVLGVPKSTVSRRIANLEKRLSVRLIERSTRRFRVTEVGQALYERCRSIMFEVRQAEAVVSESIREPRGTVRCSCPLGLMETLSPTFASFLVRFPKAKLQVVALDRPVDLIGEAVDIAVRVRTKLDTDASLLMRTLGQSFRILVAAPQMASRCMAGDIAMLSNLPTLATTTQAGEIVWEFTGPNEQAWSIRHEPRMTCEDFAALRDAAIAGLGIALLPEHACTSDLAEGRLVRVFPQWSTAGGIIHLVFTTRRGLPPVVRAFIDHLAAAFEENKARALP